MKHFKTAYFEYGQTIADAAGVRNVAELMLMFRQLYPNRMTFLDVWKDARWISKDRATLDSLHSAAWIPQKIADQMLEVIPSYKKAKEALFKNGYLVLPVWNPLRNVGVEIQNKLIQEYRLTTQEVIGRDGHSHFAFALKSRGDLRIVELDSPYSKACALSHATVGIITAADGLKTVYYRSYAEKASAA